MRVVKLALFILAVVFAPLTRADEKPARVQVVDVRGKLIELAQPAERIIALAPHIVENVYAAGAGDKLVAAVSYSDYPVQALSLPQVGSFKVVNYERILALKPDLVLSWSSGNGEDVAAQLERLGLTVYVDELRTLGDIAQEVRTLGELAGTSTSANATADQWLQKLESLNQRYKNTEPVSVMYQVWNDPLQTLNGEHLVSDVIRLCGGRNVFADAVSIAPKINIESVLARDPQAIVASGMGEDRPDWLDEWLNYPSLQAVKNKHLFFVPPDIIQRHTLRILDGAELMCEHLDSVRQ
ncbi:cobalamin-binding protein [Gilvimarinus sp. SDUM040013]|uniref:Cobalamin-binding protein n=1 Tax=Gilvimarinus gilvus TaxID=3058038 RepID=A0ABU4S2M5_9GAMM|nr:cobalamin-binding protein [Gilvimarinus sp. SDUM040013]MDO3384566.1 cobalamin-binding protein [Gilvimarinus sp. SDUM040013]MDX6850098.1 cobalamin-binding protein [Gilvimarinus sp. SDUM040013]